MIFLTGDTHREFERIVNFCLEYETTKDDIMIILGDAGINYYENESDIELKEWITSELPITLFCVHGNHEQRPEEIADYEEIKWHDGIAYIEPEYPNIIFAKDGEIYNFDGKKTIVIGGAYSIDKFSRIKGNSPWFDNEQPSEEIMEFVENKLEGARWKVDVVLSHTAPLKFMPSHSFLPNTNQNSIDKSTEQWLDKIENRLDYDRWFLGHFHIDECIGRINIVFEEYIEWDY